jgi:hypothetical protein
MNANPSFFAELVSLAGRIVSESGSRKDFDAERWVTVWLELAHPALGGRTPAELGSTDRGRMLVRSLLEQQQSGAYA